MRDEILTYWEMCAREGLSLQRGMYFRTPPRRSIVLMSQRQGAPYSDSLSSDGLELIYEGHDVHKEGSIEPKTVDQPWAFPTGVETENAKFAHAASESHPPVVRVYEKLRQGIWSDKGLFELTRFEYSIKPTENRKVFAFK